MQEMETTVTQKGQVTIPLEVRRMMGLEPHDRVRFEVEGDTVRITKAPSSVLKWYQSVQAPDGPKEVWELREEFERGVAEEAVSRAEGTSRAKND
jgi:AbrB family looped-hinge helix DNA binding protein